MSAEKIIKAQSRQKLKQGGWAKALFALALVVIVYMLCESVASIGYYLAETLELDGTLEFIVNVASGSITTIVALLLSPIILGFFRMFYSDDEEYFMGDVLYYFSGLRQYGLAIRYVLSLIVRLILPAAVFFIPPFALIALNAYVFDSTINETVFNITLVIFIILSSILLLRYSVKYFVSILLLCEDENKSISYYFRTSNEIMHGNSKSVVKLFISFIPWMLLCVLGLPALYAIPYIAQAMCISGKWLTQLSRNGQNL